MTGSSVEAQMRDALPRAMKARDQVAVSALRTGLAAIANAEAPPAVSTAWTEPVLGQRHEAPRLELTADDVIAIVRGEVEQRLTSAVELDALGQADEAATLRAEAEVLQANVASRT